MSIPINATKSGHMSFEALYEQYYTPIFKRAYFLVQHREQAEDVTQQAFLQAWQAWEQVEQTASLYGWLYRIVTNIAINLLRRRKIITFQSLEGLEHESPQDVQAQVETTFLVEQALAQLPPHYRRILRYAAADYSRQELAERMGMKQKNLDDHLYRARKTFRQHYQEQEVA